MQNMCSILAEEFQILQSLKLNTHISPTPVKNFLILWVREWMRHRETHWCPSSSYTGSCSGSCRCDLYTWPLSDLPHSLRSQGRISHSGSLRGCIPRRPWIYHFYHLLPPQRMYLLALFKKIHKLFIQWWVMPSGTCPILGFQGFHFWVSPLWPLTRLLASVASVKVSSSSNVTDNKLLILQTH